MAQTILQSSLFVNGALSASTFSPPVSCITDASIVADAGIQASKVVHQFSKVYDVAPGTAVAAATKLVHCCYAAANILAVNVLTTTPPTSSDTVTVDVKKGNAGAGFTTILGSTIGLSSSTVAKTVVGGTLTTTTAAAGDIFEIVVTVSGTSCQGLLVELFLQENPQ